MIQIHSDISQRVAKPMPVAVENTVVGAPRRCIGATEIIMTSRECICTVVVPPTGSVVTRASSGIGSVHSGEAHMIVVRKVIDEYVLRHIAADIQWVALTRGPQDKVIVLDSLDDI